MDQAARQPGDPRICRFLYIRRFQQLVQNLVRIEPDDLGQFQQFDHIDAALVVLHFGDERLVLAQNVSDVGLLRPALRRNAPAVPQGAGYGVS